MKTLEYMLAVADGIERYMKDYDIEFVHGKGKRKSDIQRLYDELKEHAIKLWEYAIHMELLGSRNSFFKDWSGCNIHAHEIWLL